MDKEEFMECVKSLLKCPFFIGDFSTVKALKEYDCKDLGIGDFAIVSADETREPDNKFYYSTLYTYDGERWLFSKILHKIKKDKEKCPSCLSTNTRAIETKIHGNIAYEITCFDCGSETIKVIIEGGNNE